MDDLLRKYCLYLIDDERDSDLLETIKNVDDISIQKFSDKDVVRHKLVQDIIKAYEKYFEEGKKK